MAQAKYTDKKAKGGEKNVFYLKDFFVTKVLRDTSNRDYLLKIISAALEIDIEDLDSDFELVDIKIGPSTEIIDSEADFVSRYKKGYINIEVNYTNNHSSTDIKNTSYICELVLRQLKRGTSKEAYKNLKPIYQINLNSYDQYGKGRFIYHSRIMEEDLHIPRDDMIRIVDINMDFLATMDYNKIKIFEEDSLEWLLYIFVSKDKPFIDDMYLGDLIMEKIKNQLYDLEKDLDVYLFYDKEELRKEDSFNEGLEEGKERGLKEGRERGLKEGMKQGEKEGFEKGQKQGALNKAVSTAKHLFKMDMPLEDIQTATELPLDELEKIKDELSKTSD